MTKTYDKLRWWTYLVRLVTLAILLMLISASEQAYAQWPPFKFRLTPAYENGKIIYNIRFSNEVDWTMTDLTFKIPLPRGTRFLEANAQSTTQVSFDGAEVTFFTAVTHQPIKDAYFMVEVTDPTITVFTTHAWIAWKGNQPGDYLSEDEVIDITQKPLNWQEPAQSRVRLEAGATVTDNIITYTFYPTSVTGQRIWDLKINVPIPEGTTFLSAEAPPPFTTNFDGWEVSFSISELASRTEVGPLRFKASTEKVSAPFVITHAWVTWKNVGPSVGRNIPAQEEIKTGDIIIQPHAVQQVISDRIGDAPFSNYDLTGIALGRDGTNLKIAFYTVGEVGPVGEPLEYVLYIDKDCRADTGKLKNDHGAEYRVRYRHDKGQTRLDFWDETKETWDDLRSVKTRSVASGNMVVIWVPGDLLKNDGRFCWTGEARNRTEGFSSNPPVEKAPDSGDPRLTQYEVLATATESETVAAAGPFTSTVVYESHPADITPPSNARSPMLSVSPVITDIRGKLAVSLNNNQAFYDVHIFSMPNGHEIANISNARQPNFRLDGQRMLVNREGGGVENVYEYNLADGTDRQVSDAPRDSFPFYDPGGNRVVYKNAELTIGADGQQHPYLYVQCGLLPPHQETELRCRYIPEFGILVPAGQMGEIQGTHPVWSANDMIAYQGCNTWAGSASCGIYIVSSASSKGFSDGFIPRQLTHDTSDIPSDTKGNLIAFMSHREGNWEVYVMGLDGSAVKNLSNSSGSNDGLPTISPDGNWVAFVSDRDGKWAIWAATTAGGPAQKLFDLPADTPWGDGDRSWTNERISWGP